MNRAQQWAELDAVQQPADVGADAQGKPNPQLGQQGKADAPALSGQPHGQPELLQGQHELVVLGLSEGAAAREERKNTYF